MSVSRTSGSASCPRRCPRVWTARCSSWPPRGLGKLGHSLAAYQQLSAELAHRHGNSQLLARLDRLQHSLDMDGGWLVHRQVEQILSHLDLDPNAPFASLSGGLKRRTLLAAALVSDPDLLLLDEPTNHLDITAIGWLEAFLLQREKALLFVTHDRLLLRKLATPDRGTRPGSAQQLVVRL